MSNDINNVIQVEKVKDREIRYSGCCGIIKKKIKWQLDCFQWINW